MVRVRLYSLLADAVGSREVEVGTVEGLTVGEFIERLAEMYPGLRRALDAIDWSVTVIVDGRRVGMDDRLEGELVHILPPSAGGLHVEVGVLRRGENVDYNELIGRLSRSSRETGGIAIFVGVVRGVNQGEDVEELIYEHSEDLANDVLERIAVEEARKHGLTGVAIYHYTGRLKVGDTTMIVAVAGESRRNVFPGLHSIVERVKHEAPIWKLEVRTGGRRVYIVGDKYIDESEVRESS